MRRIFSFLVITCLIINVSHAGEWTLSKKDPGKAQSTAYFPGLLLVGAPDCYLEDPGLGILRTGIDLALFYWLLADTGGTGSHGLVYLGLLYPRLKHVLTIQDETDKFNKSLGRSDFIELRKKYYKGGIVISSCFSVIAGAGILLNSGVMDAATGNAAVICFVSGVASVIVHAVQLKRLDNAVFKRNIEKSMSSPITIGPYFRHEYGGIMIAGRF